MLKTSILKKCKKIKLVMTDVDGVLTDGGMYYSDRGDFMKKFCTRDGMGATLLKRNNVPTIVVTKEKTMMVRKWVARMNISKLYDGVTKKELILKTVCHIYKVEPDEVAYIADDVNDLELMKKVGFSVTPKDGVIQAKNVADYICVSKGGEGVLREVADMILDAKLGKNRKFY